MPRRPLHLAAGLIGISLLAACQDIVSTPVHESIANQRVTRSAVVPASSDAHITAAASLQYLAIFGAQTDPDLVASLPEGQRRGELFPTVDAPYTEHCVANCGFLADGTSDFSKVKPIVEVEAASGQSAVWQTSKLSGQHPWGFLELSADFPTPSSGIRRTNSWVNYRANDNSEFLADSGYHKSYRYRVSFNVPDFPKDADGNAIDASMLVKMKVDNWGAVWINGTRIPGVIQGESHSTDGLLGTAEFKRAVKPGRNSVELVVSDGGGLAGFTFLIELTMQASGPLTTLPPGPTYTSTGFLAPISKGRRNAVVGGSTVPLKFQITMDGKVVTERSAIESLPEQETCEGSSAASSIRLSVTELQYLAGTRQFVLPWRVPREPGCYRVTVPLKGGEKIWAEFEVRR